MGDVKRWAGLAAGILLLAASEAAAQEPMPEATVGLDEAIELALRAQPAVVQARGNLSVARASQREAIGNWLPSLSGSSSWSRSSTSRFDPATQRVVDGAGTSMSAGLSASLVLFDGFSRLAENRAASADVTSADAERVNQEFQVVLQTKQAFFNALAAAELVRVSDTRIRRAEEQLKTAKEKLAAGSATRSDTLRSTVEVGNARLQRLTAETQLATAEANLARLIGYDGPVHAVGDSSLYALAELDTLALRAEVLQSAPSVQVAEANEKTAAAQVAVSRAQYFPTVTASYSQTYAGSALDDLNNSWSARVALSWPLFNGFTRETNFTRSTTSRETAAARAADARRQVAAQLTQHLSALRSAQAQTGIAQASLAAAEEDLRVVRERYRLGVATIIEVLTSQVTLDQAEVDIVQARLDFLVARAQLEALLGREL